MSKKIFSKAEDIDIIDTVQATAETSPATAAKNYGKSADIGRQTADRDGYRHKHSSDNDKRLRYGLYIQ